VKRLKDNDSMVEWAMYVIGEHTIVDLHLQGKITESTITEHRRE